MDEPRPTPTTILAILERLAAADQAVSIWTLLKAFEERAFGALMFVFAAPLALPMPPGVSAVLGAPLLFVALQVMVRRPQPTLPAAVLARTVEPAHLTKLVEALRPLFACIQRVVRPRWSFMFAPIAEVAVGAVCTILALIVFLPIPFGNMAPAFAIASFGLGLAEQDGLFAVIGWLAAAASFLVLALVGDLALAGLRLLG